ncbi:MULTISPECIES: hypothetical protein [unclassified Sphingomonas]|uniref:hypothetical protein n=1 Tax=unclassified Sphingomonas TaxID=196159 RepID=UPI0006F42F7D|nr:MULTISPECIES: hypothetical protein [unclassified Sphingomonas]KQN00254.1 hypothetical protein ASE78_03715 [Sphingomonas sp. Leaf25]
MAQERNRVSMWLLWLVGILWFAVAAPIVILSLLFLEVPLWPSFSEERTVEGTMVWAVLTMWVYVTPVVLFVVVRRRRR